MEENKKDVRPISRIEKWRDWRWQKKRISFDYTRLGFRRVFWRDFYSLFDKFTNGLGGNGDLELSSLVAPVPVAEEEPPPAA